MSKNRYPRFFGYLALFSMLLLSGCDGFPLLDPKGQVGIEQRNLIVIATLLMLIVVIPVIFMTIIFAWKYRASNKAAKYTPDWSHSTKIEVAVWGVPIILLIFLGYFTYVSTHKLDPYRPLESEVKPVVIQAVSLDWKWLFIYPEEGIATVNHIVFPANTPINFQVTSDSVMNSLFIPGLGGQIYAMAGMHTKLHLIANENHEFNGISANYSGAGFTGMKFKAISTSQADYQAWIKEVKNSPKQLDSAEYAALLKPSERHPVELYSSVTPDLFQVIIDKYEGMNHGPSKQSIRDKQVTGTDGAQNSKNSAAGAEE
ncbi:ubiquinol oxidase subunit II [Pseudomonas sp. 21LCFQ02]|uniref:ubiquinol oxidase subunit II n=1 Tax=unclassified Pseudomonas TaxID=196821 RepID=UPI0005EE3242|nr:MULTISPECIES: ubiquinol oxidase subunit II [unclassified Pseudomonas]MCO8161506.1 ubiquinol oxidase subunit II [Pseudomonas sp. 21LCFQ010]MCO8171121.1 ubiquinol oxidase subunit II [Pseudomonas sp. 21LCFQ02]MCQ9423812.1 ubiquinol oxidase subunit II [Pseudomonas sp. LJDD11]